MAGLVKLWTENKKFFEDKGVQQILALCGNGQLLDGNETCIEFRDLLNVLPSDKLKAYTEECLEESFPSGGFVLQDIVNQVGYRLGFSVEFGLYRGKSNKIGYDGVWTSKVGFKILAEVKTTDVYRINLDTLAEYRKKLFAESKLTFEQSSLLIVVGREDTGDLEAQIRGSRHAWDVRLISVDALLRLMRLKETLEDPTIVNRISEVLIPREFTKLDGIIELAFRTAEDVKQEEEEAGPEGVETRKKPKFVPVKFNAACIERIAAYLKKPLIRRSSAKFSTPDNDCAVTCAVSRAYGTDEDLGFWFAFHPHQKEFLENIPASYAGFGCGSEKRVFLFPFKEFCPWLEGMNVTKLEDRSYWHVRIYMEGKKAFLHRTKGFQPVDISKFLIP